MYYLTKKKKPLVIPEEPMDMFHVSFLYKCVKCYMIHPF